MNDEIKNTLKGIFWAMVICALIALCSSCRTQYIAVPQTHTEYITRTDSFVRCDSTYLHDSIYIRSVGDTIFAERWHTQYVERLKYLNHTDTLCRTDSIAVPYETIKYKTPHFNWVVMGVEFLLLILLLLFIYIRKR